MDLKNPKEHPIVIKKIISFFEIFCLISLQIFIFDLIKTNYQKINFKDLKELNVGFIPFISMFAIIYFQIQLFFGFAKIFKQNQIKQNAQKEVEKQYFNFLVEKFGNDENYKKQIHDQKIQELTQDILSKNKKIQEKKTELTKLNQELVQLEFKVNHQKTKNEKTKNENKTNFKPNQQN